MANTCRVSSVEVYHTPPPTTRFAVQDDEAAEELERALELHLGQCYVPLSTATGEFKM